MGLPCGILVIERRELASRCRRFSCATMIPQSLLTDHVPPIPYQPDVDAVRRRAIVPKAMRPLIVRKP